MIHYISHYWNDADQNKALVEGWGIFNDGSTVGVQRWDELSRFASDDEAAKHVDQAANAGSEFHHRAVMAIKHANHPETAPAPEKLDVADLLVPWVMIPEYRLGEPLIPENITCYSLRDTAGVIRVICNGKVTAEKLMHIVNAAEDPSSFVMSADTFRRMMEERKEFHAKIDELRKQLGDQTGTHKEVQP